MGRFLFLILFLGTGLGNICPVKAQSTDVPPVGDFDPPHPWRRIRPPLESVPADYPVNTDSYKKIKGFLLNKPSVKKNEIEHEEDKPNKNSANSSAKRPAESLLPDEQLKMPGMTLPKSYSPNASEQLTLPQPALKESPESEKNLPSAPKEKEPEL